MITSLFLIFVGASLFATAALFARQSLIVAYISLGVFLGPWGMAWVYDTELIEDISHIGIICLLFLLGASLNVSSLGMIWLPAVMLGLVMLVLKPVVFRVALPDPRGGIGAVAP